MDENEIDAVGARTCGSLAGLSLKQLRRGKYCAASELALRWTANNAGLNVCCYTVAATADFSILETAAATSEPCHLSKY